MKPVSPALIAPLERDEIRALERQRFIGTCTAPLLVPIFVAAVRLIGGYRVRELRRFRQKIRDLDREIGDHPVMVCANHLTMIDSVLIGLSLRHPLRYMVSYRLVPWNLPELRNFGRNILARLICYLGRCVYVERQGSLASKRKTLAKASYLLQRGDPVLIFPEGGRSRSGEVDPETSYTGVGRLVSMSPETRVLCVYMRGRRQEGYSFFPKRGEIFDASARLVHPKTTRRGNLGAKDLTRQIMGCLRELEREYRDRHGSAE